MIKYILLIIVYVYFVYGISYELICPESGMFSLSDVQTSNAIGLYKEGDSFGELFISPANGYLCRMAISVRSIIANDAIAELKIYNPIITQKDITNGSPDYLSYSTSIIRDSTLYFDFCSDSLPLNAGEIYIIYITLLKSNQDPLFLIVGDSTAQGFLFGPSYNVTNEFTTSGLNFNISIGRSQPTCQDTPLSSDFSLPNSLTSQAGLPVSDKTISIADSSPTATISSTVSVLNLPIATSDVVISFDSPISVVSSATISSFENSPTDVNSNGSGSTIDDDGDVGDHSNASSLPVDTSNTEFPGVYCYCKLRLNMQVYPNRRSENDLIDEDDDDMEDYYDETSDFSLVNILNGKNVNIFWDETRVYPRNEKLYKRSLSYVIYFSTGCGKVRCKCEATKRDYGKEISPINMTNLMAC